MMCYLCVGGQKPESLLLRKINDKIYNLEFTSQLFLIHKPVWTIKDSILTVVRSKLWHKTFW